MPESAIIKEIYEYLSFKNIVKLLFYIKQYLNSIYLKCALEAIWRNSSQLSGYDYNVKLNTKYS